MSTAGCILALNVRNLQYPREEATPFRCRCMLFRKIHVFGILNYDTELITVMLSAGASSFKML